MSDRNPACSTSFEPCGGDIEGRWRVVDVCTDDIAMTLDQELGATGCGGLVGRIDVAASGTLVYEHDGSYTVDLSVQTALEARFTAECLSTLAEQSVVLDAPLCGQLQAEYERQGKFDSASCTFQTNVCACALEQAATTTMQSSYRVDAGVLHDYSDGTDNPFCINGSTLQLSFSQTLGAAGTLVLEREQ